jgi:hypothetical protein
MYNSNIRLNLFILASRKAELTSLVKILSDYPEICFSTVKEPNYFLGNTGMNESDYHALFPYKNETYICEASVNYKQFPHRYLENWEEIYTYNPIAKFIYTVRNPVENYVKLWFE